MRDTMCWASKMTQDERTRLWTDKDRGWRSLIWTSGDGKRIKVGFMKPCHAHNAAAFMLRNAYDAECIQTDAYNAYITEKDWGGEAGYPESVAEALRDLRESDLFKALLLQARPHVKMLAQSQRAAKEAVREAVGRLQTTLRGGDIWLGGV